MSTREIASEPGMHQTQVFRSRTTVYSPTEAKESGRDQATPPANPIGTTVTPNATIGVPFGRHRLSAIRLRPPRR
jgi:hypothetical protein